MKRDIILAHLCIGCAGIIWGLMSPIGKDAMLHGIGGIDMLVGVDHHIIRQQHVRILAHVDSTTVVFFGSTVLDEVVADKGVLVHLDGTADLQIDGAAVGA